MTLLALEPELTVIERSELERHEATIERGLQTFVEVGNALIAIRDARLYRATHGTFEEYCQQRWGMTRGYANEIIRAANVVQNLDGIPSNLLPQSVHQVRPIATLTPEQQREAWQEVLDTAPESGITGKHVASIVERYKAPTEPEPDDDEPLFTSPLPESASPLPNRAYKNSSESNEWYTPRYLIDKAIAVMGGIDLDPASSAIANETVRAETYYTIEDDSLNQLWLGRVWLNPPYGRDVDPFVEKLVNDYENGDITEALLLVAARTDTGWFRRLRAYPRCFLWGRIKFVNGETGEIDDPAGFPSMVVYLGNQFSQFVREFEDIGDVYAWVNTTSVSS